jgi:hypothetical protein
MQVHGPHSVYFVVLKTRVFISEKNMEFDGTGAKAANTL